MINAKNKLILDVGCGRGELSFIANKKGALVIGLDNNFKDVMFAKEKRENLKNNIYFVIGDAEKLPFKDKSFDCILNVETLQYLKNDINCLREMKRTIKNGHYLIIEVPNENYPFFRDPLGYFSKKNFNRSWGNVLRLYNANKFIDGLKKLGFLIQDVRFIGHGLVSIFCFNYLALFINKFILPKRMRSGYLENDNTKIKKVTQKESRLLRIFVRIVDKIYFFDSKIGKNKSQSVSFIVKVKG